jgi:competence protein ComEC
VREAFSNTGTAHLLAISGMNLAVVWGWAFLLARWGLALAPGLALRLPVPKLAALAALLPTAAYAFIGGASTPTLRALVTAVCLVLALLVNRPAQAAGGLALAALVIGLIWPEAPLTLSFQLSFLAVAAIIWAALPLGRWLAGLWGRSRLAAGAVGFFVLTLVVEVALWPLTALHFHQAPWLGLPANLIMVPLVGTLVQALALLGSVVGLVWERGGVWLLMLAWWPAQAGIWLVQALAGLPGAVSMLAGPGPWVAALLYAGLAAGLALARPWRAWLAGTLAVAALGLWVVEDASPAPDGRLTLWVLDVGQGSAAVARLPGGQVLLIDGGGGLGELDLGQRVIAPFLWSQGIKRVEVVAASHRHPDHVGGLPFIARWFDSRQVWTNGAPAEEEPSRDGPASRLAQVAAERGVPVLGPAELAGERELSGARVRVLWPPAGEASARLSENDRSLWIGLGLGRTWVWLPGDAGPKVEKAVLAELGGEGEHVLLAPHHGGKGSTGAALLERLRPREVVVSCGCVNSFGMPRPDTLERVAAAGARTWLTATQGCLKLVGDGHAWRVEPYLDPPRDCPLPRR